MIKEVMGDATRISFGIDVTILTNEAEVYGRTGVNVPGITKAIRCRNPYETKPGMGDKE
jgi:hypothetical protein